LDFLLHLVLLAFCEAIDDIYHLDKLQDYYLNYLSRCRQYDVYVLFLEAPFLMLFQQ